MTVFAVVVHGAVSAWTKLSMAFLCLGRRENEFIADAFAYEIGFGNELAAVLDKLHAPQKSSFLSALFSEHPPVHERIGRLQETVSYTHLDVYKRQWYILETIDPGPRSVFRRDYFEYDQPYTRHLINKRARLYSHPLTLVGLWHRHPGSFDIFSSTDDGSSASYCLLDTSRCV